MKKILSLLLVATMLFALCPLSVVNAFAESASGTCGESLMWSFDSSTGALTISGTGKMDSYASYSPAPWDSYSDSITSVVIGTGVTYIYGRVCYGYPNVTSIYISDTVTSISYDTFSGCPSLESIVVDTNNEYYYSFGNCLIDRYKRLVLGCKNSVITNDVTSIYMRAFYNCTSLTSITIPNNVTSINNSAFEGCTGLTSINIPDSVTTIDWGAFKNCTNLTNITISNSVTTLSSTFSGCTSLTSITIPNSVTTLSSTFYGCTGLTSITIPNSVTSIVDSAFKGCTSLTKITIPNSVVTIGIGAFENCVSLTNILIPESVTSIGAKAFLGCANLESANIPKGVSKIDWYVFNGCTNLKNISIPEGVTSIGYRAFEYCENLASVTIPDSVTIIEDSAFSKCKNLTSVSLSANLTSIGERAFYNCSSLTSVTIPESVISIGKHAFSNCSGLISVTIPNGSKLTSIAESAFVGCTSLTSITIPNGVTSIGKEAFMGCLSLASVTIPESVTSIGDYAFDGCKSLTSVTIPESVTSIGEWAFYGCESLITVIISEGVTSIGYYAFFNCESLVSVTIPKSVTHIGESAFRSCDNLTTVNYLGTEAEWNAIEIGENNEDLINAYENSKNRNVATITTQPVSVTVAEGATAKVTVGATGDGIRYIWYYKNKGDTSFTKTTSFTGSTYSISMNDARNGRQVYCVVKDQYGNYVKSNVVTLSMSNPVKITTQPVSVTVAEGATAKVTLKASGGGIRYIWYFKNKGASSFTKTTSFTGPTYSVSMNDARDGRQVYCVVKDKNGKYVKSNVVTLSMQKVAKITTQPVSVTVAEGATAKVTLKASGDGIRYIWYYKNKGASSFTKTTSFTGPTYSVSMNDARNGRQVYCVVKDKYGNYVKSNVVTLSMGNTVTITSQPKSVTVASGATAKVTVKATGEGIRYIWYYKNKGDASFQKTTSFTGPTYSVTMNDARDGRQVYCVVKDKNGMYVKSNVVTLSMS